MIDDEILDGWAKSSGWGRYNEIDAGTGTCHEGDYHCAGKYVRALGMWLPPDDQDLARAAADIRDAWERANDQLIRDMHAEPNFAGHELGIHLGPDGPRMALILFGKTGHALETPGHAH